MRTSARNNHHTASTGYSPSPGGSRLAPAAGVHPVSSGHLWGCRWPQRCSEPSRRWCSWCHCPPQGRASTAAAWCRPEVWPAGCCSEAAPHPSQPESGTQDIWVHSGNRRCPANSVYRRCAGKVRPWQRHPAAPGTQGTPADPAGPTHPSSSSSPRETQQWHAYWSAALKVAHVTSMSDAARGPPGKRRERQRRSTIIGG